MLGVTEIVLAADGGIISLHELQHAHGGVIDTNVFVAPDFCARVLLGGPGRSLSADLERADSTRDRGNSASNFGPRLEEGSSIAR